MSYTTITCGGGGGLIEMVRILGLETKVYLRYQLYVDFFCLPWHSSSVSSIYVGIMNFFL